MKSARIALFLVAILIFLACGLLIGLAFRRDLPPESKQTLLTLAVANSILGLVYVGLGIWASKNPFPAAIAGLVLFVTVIVVNTALNPESLVQGWPLKLIVIVVLAKGIGAGNRYRQLRAKMDQTASVSAAIKSYQDDIKAV